MKTRINTFEVIKSLMARRNGVAKIALKLNGYSRIGAVTVKLKKFCVKLFSLVECVIANGEDIFSII